jgi:L-rhamnose-H+ transport protein
MSLLSVLSFALAGITNGSFAVPMKGIREWSWEHTWFAFTLFANGLLPVLALFCLGGSGPFCLLAAQWRTAALMGLFGALWGAGSVLYGISLVRLGIAATNALVSSIASLAASFGPLVLGYANLAPGQLWVLAVGLAALILGIVVCARSSQLRDGGGAGGQRRWATGILIAVASALLASMLNIGFAVGGGLAASASSAGYSKLVGTLVIWLPVMGGAFVVGMAYTSYLIRRGAAWGRLRSSGSVERWGRALAMGGLCFGAVVLYGFGAAHSGSIGLVYGPAMVSGGSIITSNVWGVVRGEWPEAGPRRMMYAATGFIVLSFCLLTLAKNRP